MGNERIAPTPPLGWNSWDCYGMTITVTGQLNPQNEGREFVRINLQGYTRRRRSGE